jgi:hypothetical protein
MSMIQKRVDVEMDGEFCQAHLNLSCGHELFLTRQDPGSLPKEGDRYPCAKCEDTRGGHEGA